MNYNQQRRIQQLTENTLIVGADIAKNKHVARAEDYRGIELGKRLIFDNTRAGFTALLAWIRQLQNDHNKNSVIFGIEPTGHYWLPLSQYLRQAGIQIVMVNPMHVKKSKELDDNSPTKNDTKDARVIAQLVKDGRYTEPNQLTGIYADLRVAMVQRERLTRNLGQIKNRVQNWLDRYFPEYLTVFKDWEGKASLITLKHFPLPQEITEFNVADIVATWKTGVNRTVGVKRASKLMAAARSSIGLTDGINMARLELKILLEQYNLLTRQMEELAVGVSALLKLIHGAEEMMTIPGIGWVTVAGFLAETGDLKSYNHPQQIIRLAGLNLKENSSGRHKGQTRIARRGRPRLRALLFRGVLVMVAKNQEFKQLHQHYITRAENPLKKKQSIIALCGKLIRVFYGINRTRTNYDPKKVIGAEIQAQWQIAA